MSCKTGWKIVKVDNYDREGPQSDDLLVADNVHLTYLDTLVECLNQDNTDDNWLFVSRPGSYKLKKFKV